MYDIETKTKVAAELILRQRKQRKELDGKYDWRAIARPEQLPPPGDWTKWVVLAGRGWGKTYAGVQWVLETIRNSDKPIRFALLGNTPTDAKKILVTGPSGILALSPPWDRPEYEPSKDLLTWQNGSTANIYSYANPDKLRGPEHHFALCDELVTADNEEVWDNLMFGLRLGEIPRVMVTTTPKPKKLIKKLLKYKKTVIIRRSTFDNIDNLPESFIEELKEKYEGTRLGRQELHAEILDDVEGALWTYDNIDDNTINFIDYKTLRNIIVSVDPSASNHEKSDETGIIVCGTDKEGLGYVLEDATIRGTPLERANAIKKVYEAWQADYIVAESNNGGDMVKFMIKSVDKKNEMLVKLVHASRGKRTRAEPISGLSEQNKIKFVGTDLSMLKDELCTWDPKSSDSPNRLDAMVWGFSELMLTDEEFDLMALVGKT